jgi:hypothetical protein
MEAPGDLFLDLVNAEVKDAWPVEGRSSSILTWPADYLQGLTISFIW